MSASTKLVREPRPSEHIQRKVISWKVRADMQLNKDEYTWKSSVLTCVQSCAVAEPKNDPEQVKTQKVFKLFRSILNKLTPEKLEKLVKQVTELDINTEERLRGVIELTFEKAISELSYSGVYARMCHGLMGLTVQTPDGLELNFNKLLLKRCQKAFENKDDNEILKKKQEELEAASGDREKKKLTEELEEIKYKAKRESVGTMKFIGELFKLKMLIDAVMFDCIGKLLKDNDEVSLECLCTLVSTIGKDLDLGKSKTRLDGYFSRMKQIVAEQTSNRIRFRLQDVLDLRFNKWVPRHKEQGPKTINQIYKEAKLEGRRFNQQPNRRDNRRLNQQPPSKPHQPFPPPSKPHQPSPPPSKPQKPSPSPATPTKPSLTEEQLEKKFSAIIEEYVNINDMKEALQCVQELKSTQLLFMFVRKGLEYTLDSNATTRKRMGLLLHRLIESGILPPEQYCKGLQGIMEETEDLARAIPKIGLYLSELLTPMLLQGGIPMGVLFTEISKPLIPLGTGVLLVHILNALCKTMSREQAGIMWKDAGLRWKDFLPEDEDVHKFVTEKNVEFTLGEESKESQEKKELSSAEQKKQLDTLIQDKADNHTISDWIENNLDEQQTSSNTFIRTLTTCICQSTIISGENCYIVDHDLIRQRAALLQKYLQDEKKQLQALSALQALMVQMDHPSQLLRMFFDCLYDFDVITVRTYYKWELNKDPTKPQGKDVALQSVTGFFAWLHEVN
ncbi:eukaryotic translation initiation factor 4 gamma 1-like [Paralichthys olivaceus]|uniref:eukaryotic translation initiation factor 4 gamma 1-like n=1 Tax=Paralichthys olivaceus TaxID=8255 RepID=UPI0037530793